MATSKAAKPKAPWAPHNAKNSPARARALAAGYASGFEMEIAQQITGATGQPAGFESIRFKYVKPQRKATYTPDFPLPNGIIVETKGRFVTEDRQKHKVIKDQYPGLDIRFVFSRAATKLTKVSKTTYAAWCEKYGFRWADAWIPEAWFKEPYCPKRWAAIKEATIH